MKRLAKWIALILLAGIGVVALGILSFWGLYWNVVRHTPGALDTPLQAGTFGTRVNSFAGTGGLSWVCGHDTPAAALPFGMVRLAPDTSSLIFGLTGLNRSGYFYGDNRIMGFSHTRLVGADALEGGLFRVFPTLESRIEKDRQKDRTAAFSHREEKAFPGYYAVRLPDQGVLAEMAATTRVGIHRYTFDEGAIPHVLLDVTSALGDKHCENGLVRILPESQEIEGSVRTYGSFSSRYDGLDAYFVARFNRPFASQSTWEGNRFSSATAAAGNDIGVDLTFAPETGKQTIEVRVALSYVGIANARANLEAEAAAHSFDDAVAAAKDAWEKRLSLIRVEGGTERERRIFYTALYHTFMMPTQFADVNGDYTGFDRAVHKADGFRYFTDMSLWDTFRTVHPLYTLIAPEDQRDMMISLVEMAKAGGCLPRWPSGCGYTNCMIGTPADVAVTEAYLKGIRGFDIETAYAAMRQTALTGKPESSRFAGRKGLESYLKYGYCTSDEMNKSVSCTLEYAHSDHAISLLARELGHIEDAELFVKHAQFYRNVWNPQSMFFEERDSQGNFPKERDPEVLSYLDTKERYTRGYVEGSGLQWRWYVPYDPQGLISLFPSRDYFVKELDSFFAKNTVPMGWWNPGPYYWHGNEPDMHAAYLFNQAGRPDLTQKCARWIMQHRYEDNYVGLDGNDDGGTMSAWYVFSALGFYPIAGTTRYELGSPLFDSAEIQMGPNILKIVATNNGPQNLYVQEIRLNDIRLDRTWLEHKEIAQGGTLHFVMGPSPARAAAGGG